MMQLTRREFVITASALAGAQLVARAAIGQPGPADERQSLAVLDARESRAFRLTAMSGATVFSEGGEPTPTLGFNQPYLGPIVRVRSGTSVEAEVLNETDRTITVHWHGLLVPGEIDGGPHTPIAPGEAWRPVLDIDQPATTLWFHTHVHEETARDVYAGLAGVLIVDDGRDDERGLPNELGVDDLVLVVQDKRLDPSGIAVYDPTLADVLHGFLGDTILVNAAIQPTARVPAGIVRLRLLNAANARTFTFSFADGRPFHLIGTDQGLLPAPVEIGELRMSPGERAEILVDFASGGAQLVSLPHEEGSGAGGMMHDMGMPAQEDPFAAAFDVVRFDVDPSIPAAVFVVPDFLVPDEPAIPAEPVLTREIVLNDMGTMGSMGMMMMPAMPGMAGMDMGGVDELLLNGQPVAFGINGRSFDMTRIDFEVAVGTTERWIVGGEMMGHPFHIHGARFRVVAEAGRPPRPENTGWKDTVFVDGELELWVEFAHPASAEFPLMFHCHNLEHEDRGMMGQFVAA